jgi:uncharacterized Zn finger protein
MADEGATPGPEVRRATLFCETCGEETAHRILRVEPGRAGGAVRGVARCQNCRLTHPFVSAPARSVDIEVIASDGAQSVRRSASFPPREWLRLGDTIEVAGAPLKLTRLELADGSSEDAATADRIATLWGTREVEPTVRLALVEGARSRTVRVPSRTVPRFEVGATFRLGDAHLVISAMRARGRTWRRAGDAFPAEDVSVVYARRARPPAGSSRWSIVREMPRSRTSSSSTRERSRSSPGTSRTRSSPRARSADSGAAVHRRSPS